MGKKKGSKGKEKKAARAAEAAAERERTARLAAANYMEDGTTPRNVLAQWCSAFSAFDRNGLKADIKFYAASTLPKPLLDSIMDLTRANMKERYESAGWGWNEKAKRLELEDENARFLVAFSPVESTASAAEGKGEEKAGDAAAAGSGAGAGAGAGTGAGAASMTGPADDPSRLLAFAHFRFETDEGVEVLYVHECQVAAAASRKGLGRHLMVVQELMARKAAMKFIMLTVFKENTGAMSFYRNKLKYETDMSSPSYDCIDDTEPHEILSKCLDKDTAKEMAERKARDAAATAIVA